MTLPKESSPPIGSYKTIPTPFEVDSEACPNELVIHRKISSASLGDKYIKQHSEMNRVGSAESIPAGRETPGFSVLRSIGCM